MTANPNSPNTHLPKWMVVALDVIARARATKEPLRVVSSQLAKARHLGSHERTRLNEAVFAYARAYEGQASKLEAVLLKERGVFPSQRQRDLALLLKSLQDPELLEQCIAHVPMPLAEFVKQRTETGGEIPKWWLESLGKVFGENASLVARSFQERAHPVLAIDTRYVAVQDILSRLLELGYSAQVSALYPSAIKMLSTFDFKKLPKDIQKRCWLMDDGSQLIASFVKAKPSDIVLDMCAGGGGKTKFLCQTNAQIVAMDASEKRLLDAKERVSDNVSWVVADGRMSPFKDGTFDWILLDAPCSGSGTLRRAPDLLQRLKQEDVACHAALQKDLIREAVRLLKPSGHLIYATCSVFFEENQEAAQFAEGLSLKKLSEKNLTPLEDKSDGFFVASFVK